MHRECTESTLSISSFGTDCTLIPVKTSFTIIGIVRREEKMIQLTQSQADFPR